MLPHKFVSYCVWQKRIFFYLKLSRLANRDLQKVNFSPWRTVNGGIGRCYTSDFGISDAAKKNLCRESLEKRITSY